MNWTILISFGVCLAAYLVGLLIFVIIKAVINKKKFEKERADDEKKQTSDN